MQLLTAKFAQIDATIEAKNAQIATLQAEVTELQEHRQQLLSVEQACQSVLAQADTALMMLSHVDPSQIATLRDALAAKFDNHAIGLIEPTATPEPEPAPEPTEPDAPVGDVPELEVEPVIDVEVTPEPEPPPAPQPEPAPEVDVEQALSKMPLVSLRMLAKSKGTDARGTKANIAARLKALVTPTDLRAIS
jgi:outer membrane biosynthesis protein TonB